MMVHYGFFTSLCGVGKANGGSRRGKRDRARKAIEGLLRARFGEIDQELAGVIPRLMSLESDEYTRLLLNLSCSRSVSEAIGAVGFSLDISS
jgi:hypothetical protein